MKAAFWIKLILGLALIALLVTLGYRLVDTFAGYLGNIAAGGVIEDDSGDYEIMTPEPMPTMPAYMQEDSFYDNAGSVDFGD